MARIERVKVFRGGHKHPEDPLFGPLPAVRLGDLVAYEFELPERYLPWPGRTRLERTFVLLDLGISMAKPCWRQARSASAESVTVRATEEGSWYVDLISVERNPAGFVLRDLFADVMVPTDGRHYRMLDLDELADAAADGRISVEMALDGLRRWQRFLDTHLHSARYPVGAWTDFPPAALAPLLELPAPLDTPVRWED